MSTGRNEAKPTIRMEKVDPNLTMDVCCEPDCNISVMVNKKDKENGHQARCTACLMRHLLLRSRQ
jgi:hypothetical protein